MGSHSPISYDASSAGKGVVRCRLSYHLGVEKVNDFYEILIGRTLSQDGAHCKEAEMNQRGIGICLVGNFDLAPPPLGQLQAAARIVTWAMQEFRIPQEHVIGHRDAGLMVGFDWQKGQYKSCPGAQFSMEAFHAMLPPFL